MRDIPQAKQTSSLFKVLVLSFVLHIVIGFLLWQGHTNNRPKAITKIQNKPIQAKLVFAPIPPPKPIPTQQPTIQPEVESELQAQAADNEETKVAKPTEEISSVKEVIPEFAQPKVDERRADLPQISSPSFTEKGIATRDLAKHHLKDFTRNANNALAQREAERYRQQQNSPTILKPKNDPFLTEDEKFNNERAVRVDCSSGLNKSLAVLSSFTGGNLDCSDNQSITPFINKHLNKGVEDREN